MVRRDKERSPLRILAATSAQLLTRSTHSSRLRTVCAPMAPPTVRPIWQIMMSAPALAIVRASSALKTKGVVCRSLLAASRIDPPLSRIPCRSLRDWHEKPPR
jgi:hypothetical protein